ncbi:aminotransferase class I/II-fold pyridoxal phosphate-dependent enzyme [Legionella bononiensis]|uniref:aminotransferase class I/II-fold pyridoxal phosphate-dependent enzyme n=1 Tax=Legionella bononiensis TaxID=2793102 RepID=UPI001932575E|nr:aminotransferase class I/II-fold pyridoxal phosphate-dependent enzyme [Legionella bononiensis]MBL7563937.1 aminotransferase class I/II-fold pyridoxal phosphate-dependent enzyme [Legionella bononiensis]
MALNHKIREYTESLSQQGLLRTRRVTDSAHADLIQFDSNDYLSLITDNRIAKAYQEGYTRHPTGNGGSMVLSGYHPNHQAVERSFAELLAVDDCILFSSGYAANLAVASLMGKIKVHCLIDKGIHASIYDGLILSQVQFTRYLHNDMVDLVRKLKNRDDENVIMTEGIFSMSGQLAPLSSLSDLCDGERSVLLVDEAHSFGILGEQGRGAVAHHGLSQNEVPLRVIPFGKSFASQGALVAGKKEWINALLQAARSLIYSTAISPAFSYGLLKTLDVVVLADDRRRRLSQLIDYFRRQINSSPLHWSDSSSPIQQLQLGCPHLALHYVRELKKAGISCSPIRSPTVNIKQTGLRIILNFNHQEKHINKLFTTLDNIYDNTHH